MICPPRADCIATYLPREGTETKIAPEASIVLACCIRTYPPREGPETIQVSHTNLHLNHKEHPTHLGRGRKQQNPDSYESFHFT